MYSQSDIEEAVAGGALTAEQAGSLRSFVARRNGVAPPDEEHVRILLGFNDIYILYSSIFLMAGLAWLGSKIDVGNGPSPFAALFVALAAWGLSEFFSRRRRQALPGIAYSISFVWGVFITAILAAMTIFGMMAVAQDSSGIIKAVCALLAAGAAFLYYKRFREPITISLGVSMVALAIVFLIGGALPRDSDGTIGKIVLLVLGLVVLVYAMMWDGKDPRRETARADVGFWLHGTASWMVIFSLTSLVGLDSGMATAAGSIIAIILFLVFALLALAIGRRVWALIAAYPLGLGIFNLLRGNPEPSYGGFGPEPGPYGEMGGAYGGGPYGGSPYGGGAHMTDNVMITLLILGIILLLLGAFWGPLRRMIVGVLPEGLRKRVPAAAAAAV